MAGERSSLTSSGVQSTSPPLHTRAEQWVPCCSGSLLKPYHQVGWANGSGWPCLSRGMAQVTPIGPFPPQPLWICGEHSKCWTPGSTCSSVPPKFCAGTEEATIEGLREASSIYSMLPPRVPQGCPLGVLNKIGATSQSQEVVVAH